MKKIKAFFKECVRVWKVTKKPSKYEFNSIIKITGLGLIIIGLIGFLVRVAYMLIVKGV